LSKNGVCLSNGVISEGNTSTIDKKTNEARLAELSEAKYEE
jgi:hypothetical protein